MIRYELPEAVMSCAQYCSTCPPPAPPADGQLATPPVTIGGGGGGGAPSTWTAQYDITGGDWELTDEDARVLAQLAEWLPRKVFDAHAHVFDVGLYADRGAAPKLLQPESGAPAVGDFANFAASMAALLPRVELSALVLPFPDKNADVERCSALAAAAAAERPGVAFATMLVTPAHSAADIEAAVAAHGFVGLKCYHCFAEKPEEGNEEGEGEESAAGAEFNTQMLQI